MLILSHRGYWIYPEEKNSFTAFQRSIEKNFGTESDVRDYNGFLVISHDIPMDNCFLFSEFLSMFKNKDLPLAINIKADGLAEKLKEELLKAGCTNYFTFDMSIPEMRFQIMHGLKVFTGMSDLNKIPPMINQADGIWLDAFDDEWYSVEVIEYWLKKEKKICIVSSEIHTRNNRNQWDMLKRSGIYKSDLLMLCTDQPEEARNFFYG